MKYIFGLILILLSTAGISQNKTTTKLITQISKADTVCFVADNSGCFLAYVLEVKFCKQKSGFRKVIMKTDTGVVEKKISKKAFKGFINNYNSSVIHFMNNEEGKCTSTIEFVLSSTIKGKTNIVKFKNSSCEAEYNPEMYLMPFLK